MKRPPKDPLVAFEDAITGALAFLPWEYDKPEVPAVVEDVLYRSVKAHTTLTDLVVLVEGWEASDDPAENVLLDCVKEVINGWRQH